MSRIDWKRALVLAALPLWVGSAGAEPECLDDADVCLEVVESGAHASVVASNRTTVPYTFRVRLEHLKNLKSLSAPPFRAVVRPGEEKVIGALTPIDPERPTSFKTSWGAALGSMLARHDDRWRYRMPYGGTKHQVLSQGVGGRFSHTGPAKYSFDFGMPWGTPVLAARAGRVVSVRDGNIASGTRKVFYDKANAVEVLHADGTIASYAHLRHGAVVELGENVATGQLIGLSGDTGFSTGPHLHFMVWRRLPSLGWKSVPLRFHDGSEQGFVPGRGVTYAPACSTAGLGCAEDEAAPPSESWPAGPAAPARAAATRRSDGACVCGNGAILHVDLPCSLVCGN
jgi:murein DD-endopeptidase MepM/ murein hydrolase activator NlpD